MHAAGRSQQWQLTPGPLCHSVRHYCLQQYLISAHSKTHTNLNLGGPTICICCSPSSNILHVKDMVHTAPDAIRRPVALMQLRAPVAPRRQRTLAARPVQAAVHLPPALLTGIIIELPRVRSRAY